MVFFMFNSLIPLITNGNACASIVLFTMDSLRMVRYSKLSADFEHAVASWVGVDKIMGVDPTPGV